MILTRNLQIPIVIEIKSNILKDLNSLLQNASLDFSNKIIITSDSLSKKYKSILQLKNTNKLIINGGKIEEAEKIIKDLSREKGSNLLLIGFGGGRILDSTKYIASELLLNYISMPATLSHDGIYSPVSVLENGDKIKRRFGVNPPLGIIVDLEIIETAPPETISAGIGDAVSKISSLKDWDLAFNEKDEYRDDLAILLTETALQSIVNSDPKDKTSKEFLRNLTNSLILCGLSMIISGSSRPASGAEHMISHAIDQHFPNLSTFHGYQVALGTLVTELLREEDISELLTFYKKANLPTCFSKINFTKEQFSKLMSIVPNIRKRYTILNKISINKTKANSIYDYLEKTK